MRASCKLPVIGIVKKVYPGFDVYITPTMTEVEQLVDAGADIVAIDATARPRPGCECPSAFIDAIKRQFGIPLMADVSNEEEGNAAWRAGADYIATTLSGYTPYTADRPKPDIELVGKLARLADVPVIAEGNVTTPRQAYECMQAGAYAVVVGGAITRPQTITRRFVEVIGEGW